MANLKDKFQNVEDAEKNLLHAKVEYIYATMNAMIDEQPVKDMAVEYYRLICDTYETAVEINGDN
jgi:hypothetical protein